MRNLALKVAEVWNVIVEHGNVSNVAISLYCIRAGVTTLDGIETWGSLKN